MTIAQILAAARLETGLGTNDIADSDCIILLNTIYQDVCARFREIDENYFTQVWTATAVASQTNGEYKFPAASSSTVGLRTIRTVEIKMDSDDTYYTKAKEVDVKNLTHTWDWYLANQSRAEPIYMIVEDSLWIAPQFGADNVGGGSNAQIKIYGEASVIDLISGGAETTVLIPTDQHRILVSGLCWKMHRAMQKDEASTDQQIYELQVQQALNLISNRDRSPMIAATPDTTALE